MSVKNCSQFMWLERREKWYSFLESLQKHSIILPFIISILDYVDSTSTSPRLDQNRLPPDTF